MANICNVCGKPYEYALATKTVSGVQTCVHDDPATGGGPDKLEAQRRANREATINAQRAAGAARQEQQALDPDVSIATPEGGADRQFGGNVRVRKSMVDRLAQTVDSGHISEVMEKE